MTRPTFLQGVGVALVASVAGSVLFAALPSILPVTWTLRLLIAGLAFGYLLFDNLALEDFGNRCRGNSILRPTRRPWRSSCNNSIDRCSRFGTYSTRHLRGLTR